MNGISKIIFNLENCETINIDGKYIGDFNVENLRNSISRVGCNAIIKMQSCDDFYIEISKTANIKNIPFGMPDLERDEYIFNRLSYGDITSIDIYYDDKNDNYEDKETGEVDKIWLPYNDEVDGGLGISNTYQKTYLSELGNLYILISRHKNVNEFFDIDEVNNEDYINFHLSMCDVE